MNEFTKEELECLISNHWECGANYPGLYDKLESMIETYCDHEDDGRYHIHYQGERTTKANKCKKCGEFYE